MAFSYYMAVIMCVESTCAVRLNPLPMSKETCRNLRSYYVMKHKSALQELVEEGREVLAVCAGSPSVFVRLNITNIIKDYFGKKNG